MANPYAQFARVQSAVEGVGRVNPYARFAAETAADLAGNVFFDVGATGAAALQDPATFVRGGIGNRVLGQQFQDRRQEIRDRLPTFEPSEGSQEVGEEISNKLLPYALSFAEKNPNFKRRLVCHSCALPEAPRRRLRPI
jgi:hypothetical protein